MKQNNLTKERLLTENEDLKRRLEEAEETLHAIHDGGVDALVIAGPDGDQVFTLKGAEYPYRLLLETMQEGALTMTADGNILYCNNRFAEMIKMQPSRIIDSSIYDVIEPADRKLFDGILRERGRGETSLYAKDKTHIPVYLSCSALELDDAPSVSMVITDLTEQKRNEETLKAEKLSRSILDQATEVIIVCNESGKITRASRMAHELCGANPLLKHFDEMFSLEAAPDGALLSRFSVATPLQGEFISSVSVSFQRADGRVFALLLSARPLSDLQEKIAGCVITLVDITTMQNTAEALQKTHDELEQRVEERTVELKTALDKIQRMKDQLEAENIYFRQEIKMRRQHGNIIGQSDGLKYVLYRAEQVAPTNTTVLILGETGTGKELIAAAIHNMSPRKERPLFTVNCAALPASLIESELFGREKGAFTGADARQIGRFELAHGSTLCLDEIGELPMELQAKLLRVVQHNEFERLGSSKTIKVDVRILATTNRNIEEEVKNGRFRQDLFYRLNVFPITVPPLSQRVTDIPLMVQAFVERYSRKLGKQITSVSKETMKVLTDYPWPGNVRELESIIERAIILCPGPVLQLADKLGTSFPPLSSSTKTLEEMERDQIAKTLSEVRWRIEGKNGAAEILGIHPSTLRARMHKFGIKRPETKETD